MILKTIFLYVIIIILTISLIGVLSVVYFIEPAYSDEYNVTFYHLKDSVNRSFSSMIDDYKLVGEIE